MTRKKTTPKKTSPKHPTAQQIARRSRDRLRRVLTKQSSKDLAKVLMDLAKDDVAIERNLNDRFNIQSPPEELAFATRQAIARATAYSDDFEDMFDNDMNYDIDAYQCIEQAFHQLIDNGELKETMALAIELMEASIAQVEMSDQGLMTPDIEACLQVIIDALVNADLPSAKISRWCDAMRAKDRIGFISDVALKQLKEQQLPATSP